ncbi:unnamed protein product [Dibothriocephalus latus]|uniref:Regulator of MON1-CCZ1 complex N-terminal domain-containing protein n=1 Tax=Dibothriocephalus latus TaxID=60516 RepID=A0A3P7LV15_DIBLA|nr:unnamed protein product [Dibothriocephalus latus]
MRARGALGVNVKTLGTTQSMNFRIQDRGDVLCIKFDPTCTILSLQRKHNSVEFINFDGGCADSTEYSQTCKNSSQLLGFVWTRERELVYVTADGFELYQVCAFCLYICLLCFYTATATLIASFTTFEEYVMHTQLTSRDSRTSFILLSQISLL